MGIIAAIGLMGIANAQSPDWNKTPADARANGLPEFLEGSAQGFGVGVYMGRPLSIALSYSKETLLTQMLVGMWLPNTYRLSIDQLYSVYTPRKGEYLSFPISVGVGGFAYLNEYSSGDFFTGGGTTYDHYGLRLPVSIALNHKELAFDAYVDIVPAIQFAPRFLFDVYGGVGIRVYPFNAEKP